MNSNKIDIKHISELLNEGLENSKELKFHKQLYDENHQLLAVGKLAKPLQSSPTTDTTILVNIDR